MLNRFLLYFFGVAFGLIFVDFMFPGKIKDNLNYFSIHKRVTYQIINSELDEEKILFLYNTNIEDFKRVLSKSKVDFKKSNIDPNRKCNFYILNHIDYLINVKLCSDSTGGYSSEFYMPSINMKRGD